jgi:hypothetical protein
MIPFFFTPTNSFQGLYGFFGFPRKKGSQKGKATFSQINREILNGLIYLKFFHDLFIEN